MFFSTEQKSLGIDISDQSIELAVLSQKQKKISVQAISRVQLPPQAVERGEIRDPAKLKAALAQSLQDAFPHPIELNVPVVVGLPEARVYLQIIAINQLIGASPHQVKEAIFDEASKNIPLDTDQLVVSFQSLGEKNQWLIAGVSQNTLASWQRLLNEIGFTIVDFDLEMPAAFRGMFRVPVRQPVCLVDAGALTTTVAVFDGGTLRAIHSIPVAGEAMTGAIVQALSVEPAVAEEKKRAVNLSNNDDPLLNILLRPLGEIKDAIKQLIDDYESASGKKVAGLFIFGGSSRLLGIDDYFRTNLGLPVTIGESAYLSRGVFSSGPSATYPLYVEAIGLALKNLPGAPMGSTIDFLAGGLTAVGDVAVASLRPRRWAWVLAIITLIIAATAGGIWFWGWRSKPTAPVVAPAPNSLLITIPGILDVGSVLATDTPSGATTTLSKTSPLILIQETPTGWLNVRSGPGLDYSIVIKINPGESYPLLEEREEWYRIEQGWINKMYAQIINE